MRQKDSDLVTVARSKFKPLSARPSCCVALLVEGNAVKNRTVNFFLFLLFRRRQRRLIYCCRKQANKKPYRLVFIQRIKNQIVRLFLFQRHPGEPDNRRAPTVHAVGLMSSASRLSRPAERLLWLSADCSRSRSDEFSWVTVSLFSADDRGTHISPALCWTI
jgi:hypothetical protein